SLLANSLNWEASCADRGAGPAITFSEKPTSIKQKAATTTIIFFITFLFSRLRCVCPTRTCSSHVPSLHDHFKEDPHVGLGRLGVMFFRRGFVLRGPSLPES